MSSTSSTVGPRHFEYLAARTTPEDPLLVELKRAAAAADIPAIQIAPEQAAFMQILLRLHESREVVEVGTLAGYSAIAMARALPPGGRVRTIEVDPRHAAFAREWAERSGVAEAGVAREAGRVEVLEGAGADVLPTLADGSADALFVDADKVGYSRYLEEGLRILRPGGLVMVDNAFAFGRLFDEGAAEDSVAAVLAFNDAMAAREDLEAVIVPLGDGLWVGVKRT